MVRISKRERNWLILFGLILFGLIAGCMYETVTSHKPIGPGPARRETTP